MAGSPDHPELLETLRQAQRLGFFGARPIEEAYEHSLEFARALGELGPGDRIVDLGSGGGLPGLVLAGRYGTTAVCLVDRREKRTDFLRRAVARLGYTHVEVRCVDAEVLVREVTDGLVPVFSVVTARGFGPPELTLRLARQLLTPIGRIVISEPPSGDRWSPELLDELDLDASRAGPVRVFQAR